MRPGLPGLPRPVRIHYRRPPERLTVFEQLLVHDDGRVKVTLARGVELDAPLLVEGPGGREVALEPGSDAVWFTFPGAWHDIGLFHRADGVFTGTYANVITPCVFEPGGEWETTDLFLDVWIPEGGGEARLLDEDELAEAERRGWIDAALAGRARDEAARILAAARAGRWPPPALDGWDLGAARRTAEG